MEAGMIAGFLWFQGTFLQFGTIQVLGKENIQPDFLEVRLAEVKKKKKKKKKNGRNSNFDKSCLWNDRQKGDVTSHIAGSLHLQSMSWG